MKYFLSFNYNTDGDYFIDHSKIINKVEKLKKDGYVLYFNQIKDERCNGIDFIICGDEKENNKIKTKNILTHILNILLISIEFNETHCYLIETFYNFFRDCIESMEDVKDLNKFNYSDSIDGNYKGTTLIIKALPNFELKEYDKNLIY